MTGETWYQRDIPLFGKYLKSDELLNRFNPSELKQLEKIYNTIVHIDSANTFPIEALENYDNRAKDYNVFSTIKWPTEGDKAVSLCAKLKNDETDKNSRIIIDSLNRILTHDTAIKDKFNEAIDSINSKLASQDSLSLIHTITDTVKEIRSKIVEEQQAELNALKALFDRVDFTDALKERLEVKPGDDFDFDSIKNNMINARKESHQKQLDDFETITCEYLAKCHNDAVAKRIRLLLIAALHKNDAALREIMDKLLRQEATLVSENDPNEKLIELSKINLDDEELLKEMGIIKNNNTYTVNLNDYLSLSLTSTLDYLSPYQKVQAKIDVLARVMKAKGIEDVTITVQFSDKEIALERARQSYQAFRKAGYDPEKFVIKVNDEVYKTNPDPKDKKAKKFEVLFQGHYEEYALINRKATENKAELQQLGLGTKKTEEYKEQIRETKNTQPSAVAPNQPQAGSNLR